MTDKYAYNKFATMPYTATMAVSPFTPMATRKVVKKLTHSSTVTVPAGSTLDGVLIEPFTNSSSENSICRLHYALLPVTGTALTATHGPYKLIPDMPSSQQGVRYIGGYMRFKPYTGHTVSLKFRYLTPTDSSAYYTWTYGSMTGSSIERLVPTLTGDDSVYYNMSPDDLRYKNYSGIDTPSFPQTQYRFQVSNTGSTDIGIFITGEWWYETYNPEEEGVEFIQDEKCPYKLSEYILAHLKGDYSVVLESEIAARTAGLDGVLDAAIENIVGNWAMLTSDITITGDGNGAPEDPEPEDWTLRKRIWNP